MEERMQNQKENGDPYYQIKKNTIYQDYDLALSNKLSKINI